MSIWAVVETSATMLVVAVSFAYLLAERIVGILDAENRDEEEMCP